MCTILLIDDDDQFREQCVQSLRHNGKIITHVGTSKEALSVLDRSRFDIVLLDLELPDGDGFDLLRRINRTSPDSQTIILTKHDDIRFVVRSVRMGALDYVCKSQSPDLFEEIRLTIERAAKYIHLREERDAIQREMGKRFPHGPILGKSPLILEIRSKITAVAGSDAPVMICGDSGTGKELIALNIWKQSTRGKSTFWPLNCGNIPRDLIGSELFGHEKGAFTGAVERRSGAFEIARGGVLFLDEIGELAYEHQSNLLRVLEEKTFCRIGGKQQIQADVRVISATNKNLEEAVEKSEFRRDLFYRLNVVAIEVPSLKERREDIPILSRFFLEEACCREGKDIKEIDPDFMDWLLSQEWPGNIRELQNVIRRTVILSPPGISILSLPENHENRRNGDIFSLNLGLEEAIERLERLKITRALQKADGNVSKAAQHLRINRNKLIRRMEKLGITA